MEVYRGEIFLVKNFVKVSGSEQTANRPAVVVSNNIGNYHSDMCQVVYLTTKEKKPLPTHAKVMCQVPSTALCEQVHSVSQDRLTEWIRTCTDEEMKEIDRALMVSLGLDMKQKANLDDCEDIDDVIKYQDSKQIDDLKMKLEKLKCELKSSEDEKKDLQCRMDESTMQLRKMKEENVFMESAAKDVMDGMKEENIKLMAERDIYKSQYEELLERMIDK